MEEMEETSDAAQTLGRKIDDKRKQIEQEWLARVQRDVVKTPHVGITQLRDAMPDYLVALVGLLRGGASAADTGAGPAWADVAREHGVTRVRIGFDIGQLVHEFVVLRHVIWDNVGGAALGDQEQAILADLLEAAIGAAVKAYVDARDYESRRAQAENIAFVTHELRNPLTAAMTTATHLRRQASPDQIPSLDRLDRAHHKLAELIDSVLLTQRLEAGEAAPRPVDVSLKKLIEGALETARKVAAEKGLELRVDYDPAAQVQVDPVLTRSALQNLADNAVKYTDAGTVQVSAEITGDVMTVHVRDNCHGLSPEELRTIFEPFKRGRTEKAGTGLGLAIARRAVEAQGGSIHAESTGLSGCHFWVTLPVRPGGG
jgi:signal transduction histidine kinase